MKTRIISKKLPELIDYAFAVVMHSVPGMAEADGETKQLYQSLAKELLYTELKTTQLNASRQFRKLSNGMFVKVRSSRRREIEV